MLYAEHSYELIVRINCHPNRSTIILISTDGESGYRNVNCLAHSHINSKRESQDPTPDSRTSNQRL